MGAKFVSLRHKSCASNAGQVVKPANACHATKPPYEEKALEMPTTTNKPFGTELCLEEHMVKERLPQEFQQVSRSQHVYVFSSK